MTGVVSGREEEPLPFFLSSFFFASFYVCNTGCGWSFFGRDMIVQVPLTNYQNYGRPIYLESWQILTLLELFLGHW